MRIIDKMIISDQNNFDACYLTPTIIQINNLVSFSLIRYNFSHLIMDLYLVNNRAKCRKNHIESHIKGKFQ